MKPALTLLAALVTLAVHATALADSGRSLTDVRKEINSGTWSGTTLIEAKPKPKAEPQPSPAPGPASASAGAPPTQPATTAPAVGDSAPQSTTSPPAATGTTSTAKGLGVLFGWGEPPTGQPMSAATRLDSPSIGIPLPTAAAASAAAASTPGR